jgi:Rrf2 family protein
MTAVGRRDEVQTVEQIAAATQVPAGYLAKVLQSLTRAGLIASQRGVRGGFRLAKPAGETTLYEVIQAVDPMQRIHECPLGLQAHGTHLCPLHRRLDDAMAQIEAQFRATTIGELVQPPQEVPPCAGVDAACVFPGGEAAMTLVDSAPHRAGAVPR